MVDSPDPSDDAIRTDRSLVVLVREGDEDAARLLYDRYARRVFGLVKSQMGDYLKSNTEPEDLVQSVFRSIFRGVQSGRYDAPAGETLWSLVAVIAATKVKLKGRTQRAARRDVQRNVPLDSVPEHSIPEASESAELLRLSIHETLDSLRQSDREIVALRMKGFSVQEISKQSGRSHRTVERSLQNSRIRLAELLQ